MKIFGRLWKWMRKLFRMDSSKEVMTLSGDVNRSLTLAKNAIELGRALDDNSRERVDFNIKEIEADLLFLKQSATLRDLR